MVHSWWDYGYYYKLASEHPVLWDGGTGTARRLNIVGRIRSTDDPQLCYSLISGPFGAVKEQSSGLYAQAMAERGFLTIAFDPSFTGESGGNVRFMASPDINTKEDEDIRDPSYKRLGSLFHCERHIVLLLAYGIL